MRKNESWVAEQARLLDLEEGFGPTYVPAITESPTLATAIAEQEAAAP